MFIQSKNQNYFHVIHYLKENKDGLENITIAVNGTSFRVPKDLLLLNSPLMRNILATYSCCSTPHLIIPDMNSETARDIFEILLDGSSSSSRYLFRCAVNNIFIMIRYRNSAHADGGPRSPSAHAGPFVRPPISMSGNFLAHVSAESPSNISPNPSEVISEVLEP